MVSLDFFLSYLILVLLVLMAVAFLTLLERKVLSLTQVRKGPSKVGFWGLLQPFADGVKLFGKEEAHIVSSALLLFFSAPVVSFLIIFFMWSLYPVWSGMTDLNYSLVVFLCCVGAAVYGVIFSGWASNSKYGMIGALRAVAQTVSYELVLSFMVFLLVFMFYSFSLKALYGLQKFFGSFYSFMFFVMVLFLTCVVETNRAPFDLAEGESELVSGFNVEYGGLKFALIFLGEYASILWMSLFISFVCGNYFFFVFFFMLFLYLRSSYPRVRYDFMMMLMWKSFLFFLLYLYIFFLFL